MLNNKSIASYVTSENLQVHAANRVNGITISGQLNRLENRKGCLWPSRC